MTARGLPEQQSSSSIKIQLRYSANVWNPSQSCVLLGKTGQVWHTPGIMSHHSSAGLQQLPCLAKNPECKAITMLNVRKLQSPAISFTRSNAVVYILLTGTSVLQGIVSSCRATWKSPAMPGHTVDTSGFRA